MPEIAGTDVSRETIERLERFVALIQKWNKTINLVAKSTIPNIWDRHIVDSAQIFRYAPTDPVIWADFGSGGGLPGIVVATLLKEKSPECTTYLVESDQRKATFLRTAARELGINVKVKAERAEATDTLNADVVSARALMPLDGLCALADRHLRDDGTMIVLKGRTFSAEIEEARNSWQFDVVAHESMTDNEARILKIRNLKRANT